MLNFYNQFLKDLADITKHNRWTQTQQRCNNSLNFWAQTIFSTDQETSRSSHFACGQQDNTLASNRCFKQAIGAVLQQRCNEGKNTATA